MHVLIQHFVSGIIVEAWQPELLTGLIVTLSYVISYLAKHSGTQYRQAQTRHSRQRLDKMEKTIWEEANSFSIRLDLSNIIG
jgi:hypothetical protein